MATLTHPKGRTVTVPDDTADFYIKNGWSVAGTEAAPDAAESEAADDLTPTDKWTNEKLEAYALEHKIDLDGATKKADLLAAIAVGKKIEDKGDGDGPDTDEGHSVPAGADGDSAN